MRKRFAIIALLLGLASAYTALTPGEREARPSISWTAGLSQDRVEQVAAFHEWMKKTGRVDENGEPLFTVKLETADNQSTLIQAVSGMAGDLIVKRFAPMGVLEDITEFARENGLDPGSNYGAAGDLLMYGGRQYAYACNLAAPALLCNADLFRQYGMEPPPEEWTPEEFESIGLEFIRRANEGRPRQEVFFAGAMPQVILPLARSMGGDVFNETLTAPALASEPFLRALALYHRWVAELHLIPTAAELASENNQGASVNGEATPQLAAGRYAMIASGRYVNMDLRRFRSGPVALSFSQFPEYGFKNLVFLSRNTAVYKGSKHKEYAKIFLLFLASREYNDIIIRDSDGLPPNPKWAENNPDYRTPPGREYEGNLHARAAGEPEPVLPAGGQQNPLCVRTGCGRPFDARRGARARQPGDCTRDPRDGRRYRVAPRTVRTRLRASEEDRRIQAIRQETARGMDQKHIPPQILPRQRHAGRGNKRGAGAAGIRDSAARRFLRKTCYFFRSTLIESISIPSNAAVFRMIRFRLPLTGARKLLRISCQPGAGGSFA